MARARRLVGLGLAVLGGWAGTATGVQEPSNAPVLLRERATTEGAVRVLAEMKAQGELRPAAAPGAKVPAGVPLRVESRFDYYERVTEVAADGQPTRAARYARQAAVAINSPGRPMTALLRPEVSTLLARVRNGQVVMFSPGGPLTRQELDMVQLPADPLLWSGLLPAKPVAVGETWAIGAEAARALSEYEALATNTLRAKLEEADAAVARIHLAGQVRGAVRGGEGTVTIDGTLTFDRAAGRVSGLDLERTETRAPGHVEAGLDFKGRLTVKREPADVPAELADTILAALPAEVRSTLELLKFTPPEGRYVLYHDRYWHLFWEDRRLAVLKRLDQGEIVAQCNLSRGPQAGKGRHQDPAQFRQDIREALGKRFTAFVGAGEVSEDPEAGFRYKVAVQGREGDRDVLWYYYLIASPEGDQLLATFTLNLADKDRLGNKDLEMVGTLEWVEEAAGRTGAAGATSPAPPAAGEAR